MWAEKEDFHVAESGLPLILNVVESKQAAASTIADWVKKRRLVFLYVQITAAFCADGARSRLETESWARTIDLAVGEMGWKVAVIKTFFWVVVRRILALKVVCETDIDRPCDAVRDKEENRRNWNTQKATVVNTAMRAFKFRAALPRSGSIRKSHAGAKQK